jgi:hypothetical protein
MEPGAVERTIYCSERKTFGAFTSSIRPRGFFDLYIGAHEDDVRIVHQRVLHTIAIFYIPILAAWAGDLRIVVVRRGRPECVGLKVALRVEALPS